jgi:hypothetical protein
MKGKTRPPGEGRLDNLPARVEIGTSRFKLIGLAVIGIGMTTGSFALAFRFLPGIAPGSFGEFVGYVGVLFFGLATLLGFWRFFTAPRVVVTMDAEGIHDARISEKMIPWSAIRDIFTWQIRRQKFMILVVDAEFERQLNLSRLAQMARRANRAVGADGLSIGSNDLKTDYDTLFSTAKAYWKNGSP